MQWGKGARRKRIAAAVLHVVLWPLLLIPRCFWPWRGKGAISSGSRILLIRMDGIGDLAMSSAALSALRRQYPGARIDLLTSHVATPIAELLVQAGWINHVFTMPLAGRSIGGYLSMAGEFRKIQYDAAVDMRGDARTVMLMWLAGAPQRVGLISSGLTYLLTDIVDLPQPHHQAVECAEMVRRLGVQEVDPWPRLPLLEPLLSDADRWLADHGVIKTQPVCAMHIGAFMPTKVWPKERFLAVARKMREGFNAQILLIGGKTEVDISRDFAKEFGEGAIVAAGETSLPLTVALLSRCSVMIGNDSGPGHLAAYAGCPVVIMFGPSDPNTYRPLSDRIVVLKSVRPCDPNCERVCQRPPESHCMLEHSVDAVFAAAQQLMQNAPNRPLSSRVSG